MAIPRRMHIENDLAFCKGAFLVGGVEQVPDFDAPQREDKTRPQKRDKETGLLMWTVPVLDADPEAGKNNKTINVKILADHQPVPPENPQGLPFVPVEFIELAALPYVEYTGGKNSEGFDRTRIVWSFSALGMRAPGETTKRAAAGGSASKAAA